MIDWERGKLLPRKGDATRRECFYPVTCPVCSEERWLSAHDARNAEREGRSCAVCQRREAGRRGYRATRGKYGDAHILKLLEAGRQYRLAHPSILERNVMNALDALGISDYEREAPLRAPDGGVYYVDFRLGALVIEVQGAYWHSLPSIARRDVVKRDVIASLGLEVIYVQEKDARSEQAARSYLKNIVERVTGGKP